MKNKLFILDAMNFLFRSYYAIKSMTNDEGHSTNALYGFVRSILKLKKDFEIEYLVVVFDGYDNAKSRQKLYPAYKTHRQKAPADLYAQFDLAIEYCKLAGIPFLSIDGVEADDTMATLAVLAEKEGFDVFLCTGDKDLCQLVNDHIFLLHPHKNNLLIDREKVKEQFGVYPHQILDLLAIVGDASDNIPGIEGFGPKTATQLLQEFGSLDNILENVDLIKNEKKQLIIKSQRQQALLSK